MKKLLPFLIAFIFSLSINAQTPSLSFTNVTGSNSITCNVSSINYIASVSNYTAGPLTYTWVSLSGTASGTNVTLSNPSTYTLTAFNIANSFSLSQVFTIGLNQTVPNSTVTPLIQNIVCGTSVSATFTGITTSTMTNITHAWYNAYSAGPAVNGGTISIMQFLAPGIYTYVVTNNINGCAISKTVNITGALGFPTYSITSPQQFTIGCSTASVTTINIINTSTFPSGGPVSYTVLPPSFFGPTYNTGASSSYTANAPGQYTVIVKDNNTNCQTKVPISIIQNTVGPNISISALSQTLTCDNPTVIAQAMSTGTNVSFAWSYPGPGNVSTSTVLVNSTPTGSIIGGYTLIATSGVNSCSTSSVIPFYQNKYAPTASINPPNPSISCTTPSVFLTNSSISNIPPVFFSPLGVVGFAWYGPVPQASLANSSSYLAYTPGTYTLIAMDLNNGCTTTSIKTIIDNRMYPFPITSAPFNINCPVPTATIFPTLTGPTPGFTYSWTAPATATTSSLTQPTIVVNTPGNYTITVTNPANSCASTSLITVAICAGIEQNSLSNGNISVFPNPNNGVFTIDLTGALQNSVIEIYSALGVLVKKQTAISDKNSVNLMNEANGLYFIYVISGDKAIKVSKIVKN
jgi:hypothetical protein